MKEVPISSLYSELRQLNKIDALLKEQGVRAPADFYLLDDLVARFILDFIIQHIF